MQAHVLYGLETHVLSFYHITTASVHYLKAIYAILYKSGLYYVINRGYNAFQEFFRINCLESFFMFRAKQNLKFKCVKWKRRLPANVPGDAEIEFAEEVSLRKYPDRLRLVRFHDTEQNRDFAFLTNNFSLLSLRVADLYRNRWQVELFFKWLKQHLKIKKFRGVTENVVRIQMSVTIITYCLVAVVRNELKLERSTYELLQILSISLTDKTPMRELFEKQEIEAPDVPVTPFLPGLFD